MKIVLFGLTGDPVTSAHMEIIERLSSTYDKVVVIPTNVNYYKNYKGHDRAMFSFTERYDNLVSKCKKIPNVEVSDIERNIKEGWRFFDTVLALIDKWYSDPFWYTKMGYDEYLDYNAKWLKNCLDHKDVSLYIAMGSDSLQNFKTWYKWEELLTIAKLVVFNRPGYTDNFPKDIDYEYLEMNNDISSTKVRKNLIALMEKFDDQIEDDDFDTWIDDITWAKEYNTIGETND